MKRLLCAMVFGLSGLAVAGDLEDADKFLAAKAYDKALPLYAKLAQAGNVEAQFRLGEMYWYGDGTAVDMKSATAWMQKAAARGHGGAVESLAILKQREVRAADIAYWTSGYKGDDLTAGRFNCTAPQIPAMSKTNQEIKKTSDAYLAWQQCYNGFVANINDAMPPGKRIPADVAKLLTPREAEQAVAHLTGVYGKTIAQAEQEAQQITAQHGRWHSETERVVLAENTARRQEYDMRTRRMQENEIERQTKYPSMTPQPVSPPPATGR
ncbi:tetratricopeptide repeat protein [Massilia sp. GCM10023247]|uniref:tetratricopeptide repeat protein n=1 Tax=Massilia sp. GCM10023247 TaxID=3252643 RepID=UPI0036123D12